MSSLHENTIARRQALQVLFQNEFLGLEINDLDPDAEELLVVSQCPEEVSDADLVGEPLSPYAQTLLSGVIERQSEIDPRISETAQNWTLERMPIVDRNIIRIAIFEMAYCDDIPVSVAINEAVELAKSFGGDESPKFVNGILGRIADALEAEQESE